MGIRVNRAASLRAKVIDALEGAGQLDEVIGRIRPVAEHVVGPFPLRRLLSGTDLGHPSHPMLVQLPVGLWVSTWVLDLSA